MGADFEDQLDGKPSALDGTPVLATQGIVKRYGHVTAVDNVSISLAAGEVLGLLGDNGAGKSTLVSILSGVQQPDAGQVMINGRPEVIDSPGRAQELGISTVFQDLALVPERSVAANLFLGREPTRLGVLVKRRQMVSDAESAVRRLGVSIPSVKTEVGRLSGGQRQVVAVSRTLLGGATITIMDEPVAALGVRESKHVLDLIRNMRAQGHAVLLVSHNMETVFELCDRVVVMRLGRKVADTRIADTTREEIIDFIVREKIEVIQ
jgi:ABC-type sugar transport system ATPase subunit